MLEKFLLPLTLAAAVGCGLIGGVFFAFSTFVMKALGRLPIPQGIAAMQSINIVVLNPVFLGVFIGTTLLSLALVVLALLRRGEPGMPLLLAAGLLYVLGTFLVTAAGNVPLNDRLATAIPDSADASALWSVYLKQWTLWNHIRTVAAVAAMAAYIVALYQRASHQ